MEEKSLESIKKELEEAKYLAWIAKLKLHHGEITYEQAKEKVLEFIKFLQIYELKKYGQIKASKISIAGFLR